MASPEGPAGCLCVPSQAVGNLGAGGLSSGDGHAETAWAALWLYSALCIRTNLSGMDTHDDRIIIESCESQSATNPTRPGGDAPRWHRRTTDAPSGGDCSPNMSLPPRRARKDMAHQGLVWVCSCKASCHGSA